MSGVNVRHFEITRGVCAWRCLIGKRVMGFHRVGKCLRYFVIVRNEFAVSGVNR